MIIRRGVQTVPSKHENSVFFSHKVQVLLLESWLNHQEVNVVLVFGLEGLGNDVSSILVLPTSQGNAIDLQDDLTHPQLTTDMSRASFLSTGTRRE